MKKRILVLTFILTMIFSVLSTGIVWADDDHGEDAHSDTMSVQENEEDFDDDLTTFEIVKETVIAYLPYIGGGVVAIIVLVIIINIFKSLGDRVSERKAEARSSRDRGSRDRGSNGRTGNKGKYKGKHDRS